MSSCNPALGMLLHFLTFSFQRDVVAWVLRHLVRRRCSPHVANVFGARTSLGRVHQSNWHHLAPTRCGGDAAKHLAWWRKGAGAARQWAGAEWHGKLCCALGLHSWWTRSRPLRSAHSCTARPPLLPSLNLCCVCAACDRRRRLLLLWSQDRRVHTARRCDSLLYTGLHHTECLGPLGASADQRGASIPWGSWWHRCTAAWLPRALWAPQASRARVFCVERGPGARGRCT